MSRPGSVGGKKLLTFIKAMMMIGVSSKKLAEEQKYADNDVNTPG
jgi:hypothetical protein